MDFKITRDELFKWCSIPYQEIEGHPDLKCKLALYENREVMMKAVGNLMTDEVIENNAKGLPTRWILPAGPMDEYDTFIARVNAERINLDNLYIFHMDEFLDWECRPYPIGDTYESLEGTMNAGFYDRIDPELAIPMENRFWPRVSDMDAVDKKIEEMGGIDTVWCGVGARGLIAFNEAPRMYHHRISIEDYKQSKTRIVAINPDTIVALSERTFGTNYDRVPPLSVTIGFKSILSAKRAVFMVATGSWKQTSVRVALFSDETLEFPVTLLTKYIPECIMYTDVRTLDHPMSYEIRGW